MLNGKNKYLKHFLYFLLTIWGNTTICTKRLSLEFGKEFPKGCLSINFLSVLKEMFNATNFIETGTHLGYTTSNAAQIFDKVETIELSSELAARARENLSAYKNTTVYDGDSSLILNQVLSTISGKAIIWLDGHFSGYFNGGDTALGSINTPIKAELKCIKDSGIKNSIVLIDDIRLFDKLVNIVPQLDLGGYPDISEMCSMLLDINPDYEIVVMGDMLMAFEKSADIEISEVLKAYSLLRLTSNYNSENLIEAEKSITNASGAELQTIYDLYNLYSSLDQFKLYGIGSHYVLLYSLTLLKDQQYDSALQLLNGPIKLGLDTNYIANLSMRVNQARK